MQIVCKASSAFSCKGLLRYLAFMIMLNSCAGTSGENENAQKVAEESQVGRGATGSLESSNRILVTVPQPDSVTISVQFEKEQTGMAYLTIGKKVYREKIEDGVAIFSEKDLKHTAYITKASLYFSQSPNETLSSLRKGYLEKLLADFIVDTSIISISVRENRVDAGPLNIEYQQYNNGYEVIRSKLKDLRSKEKEFSREAYQDSLIKLSRSNFDYNTNFIRDNPQSFYALRELFLRQKLFPDGQYTYKKLFQQMHPTLQNSTLGQELSSNIAAVDSLNNGKAEILISALVEDKFGKSFQLAELRSDTILLEFGASWCGPCVYKEQELKQHFNAISSKGIKIVGISIDDKKSNWLKYLQKYDYPWPQYHDPLAFDSPLVEAYKFKSIPHNVLFVNGRVSAYNIEIEDLLNMF